MRIVLFNILLCIAGFVFIISAVIFLISVFAPMCARSGKSCTQKGAATLIRVTEPNGRGGSRCFEIAYTCDGINHQVMVPQRDVEAGIPLNAQTGMQLPIWYDPKEPERVIISEEPSIYKTVESWKRKRRCCLILMLIFGCLTAYALLRTGETEITIGQFSDEIEVVADQSPTALVYTESIGAPGTFSTVVDDPAAARKALDVILSVAVDRRGCQMDMNRLMGEEYSFVIGGESCAFRFVPDSYFCYDGKYYELRDNQLAELRGLLHEMAAETEVSTAPQSK